MKKLLIIALLIVGCASKLNTNPDDIQVITSDIDRFWSTVDNYEGDLSNALDKEYIKKGTNGLKDFIPKRIISAEALAEHYLDNKEYYNSIRESTLQVEKAKGEIINILYEFTLYIILLQNNFIKTSVNLQLSNINSCIPQYLLLKI